MKSCTHKRRKAMALKKRDNNQSKSKHFDELSRNSNESLTLNNENYVQKIHFMKNSEVKQQNTSFDQYVEMKHNDYWLKRKHLLQKYSISIIGKTQLAPSQLYEKSSNMLRFHKISDKFPATCNVSGAMYINRRLDVLEEQHGRLALKKKIKNRKDKDTLLCNKNFLQIGMGEEYLFHCNIDKCSNSINAYAA